MISYILDTAMPWIDQVYVIANRKLINDTENQWLEQQGIVVVKIDSHRLGPAYSIYSARDSLPTDQAALVSYTDITWLWPDGITDEDLASRNIVFTARGHPHLVQNPYSAFCELDVNGRVTGLSEKVPFTSDWLSEPLSIGAFSFTRLSTLVTAVERQIRDKIMVNGEYFPTLAISSMLGQENFDAVEVDKFVHWGTPEQLEDLIRWRCAQANSVEEPLIGNAIVLCSGSGTRMAGLKGKKKPFIQVASEPMYELVIKKLGLRDPVIVVTEGDEGNVSAEFAKNVLAIPQTDSQVASIAACEPFVREDGALFIAASDCFGNFDQSRFEIEKARGVDAIFFAYEKTLLQQKMGAKQTSVTWDRDEPTIHVKSDSPSLTGLAGFAWFRDSKTLFRLCGLAEASTINQEPILDHLCLMIAEDSALNLSIIRLSDYFHLGSPEEMLEYEYWLVREPIWPDISR